MRFILSALKSGYDIQNIVVISSDNNYPLKAKENGLVHRKMPETYLIKEELSEEEKEIKALKQELEQYKNRQPKPAIRFSNSESRIFYFIVPFCNHPQHNWKSHLGQVLLQFCYRNFLSTKTVAKNLKRIKSSRKRKNIRLLS